MHTIIVQKNYRLPCSFKRRRACSLLSSLREFFFRCVRGRTHLPALMMRKSRTVGVVQCNGEESP